jgi:hypothetical protein
MSTTAKVLFAGRAHTTSGPNSASRSSDGFVDVKLAQPHPAAENLFASAWWTGCLGDYGNARGVWSRSADRVSFVSRESTGMLESYLRGATVVNGGEFPALVLDQERDFYQKHGLSRYAALQRTSLLPK